MYETYATVVGTIVTSPVVRTMGEGGEPIVNFRLAGNVRRTDSSGEWVDGDTLYLTVGCRRRLVDGVIGSLDKGDPVVVHGRIHTDEYTGKDGARRSDLVMRASAVGPDVARVRVHLERVSSSGHAAAPVEAAVGGATDPAG